MTHITIDELRYLERHNGFSSAGSLPHSAVRAEIADQTIGLLFKNGEMSAKEIRSNLTFKASPQQVGAVLTNLVLLGKLNREERQDKPIQVEGRWIIPNIMYYKLKSPKGSSNIIYYTFQKK